MHATRIHVLLNLVNLRVRIETRPRAHARAPRRGTSVRFNFCTRMNLAIKFGTVHQVRWSRQQVFTSESSEQLNTGHRARPVAAAGARGGISTRLRILRILILPLASTCRDPQTRHMAGARRRNLRRIGHVA